MKTKTLSLALALILSGPSFAHATPDMADPSFETTIDCTGQDGSESFKISGTFESNFHLVATMNSQSYVLKANTAHLASVDYLDKGIFEIQGRVNTANPIVLDIQAQAAGLKFNYDDQTCVSTSSFTAIVSFDNVNSTLQAIGFWTDSAVCTTKRVRVSGGGCGDEGSGLLQQPAN